MSRFSQGVGAAAALCLLAFVVMVVALFLYSLFVGPDAWIRMRKNDNNPVAPVFCVKVTNHGNDYYQILFTNDNFKTESQIEVVCDLSFFGDPARVSTNPFLDESYEETVKFAKQFTSYERCIEHNRNVQAEVQRLLNKYQHFPPKNEYPEKKPNPRVETVVVCESLSKNP